MDLDSEENVLASAKDLRPGQGFTFQTDNCSKWKDRLSGSVLKICSFSLVHLNQSEFPHRHHLKPRSLSLGAVQSHKAPSFIDASALQQGRRHAQFFLNVRRKLWRAPACVWSADQRRSCMSRFMGVQRLIQQ